MSANPAVDRFVQADGTQIWVLDVPFATARLRRVFALSDVYFFWTLYAPHQDLESDVAQLREGTPAGEVLGQKATVIRLAWIDRVEELGFLSTTQIYYCDGDRAKVLEVATPDHELHAEVFETLHQRLANASTIETVPTTATQALTLNPWIGFCAMVLAIVSFAMICMEDNEGDFGRGRFVQLFRLLHALGPRLSHVMGWTILASVVAGLAIMVFRRIKHRPNKRVFSVSVRTS